MKALPKWLAHLQSVFYKRLPAELSKEWSEKFARAAVAGVDLEPVKWKFGAYLMSENIKTVRALDIQDDLKKLVLSAIGGVLKLHEDAILTGLWDKKAARLVKKSVRSAMDSAALAERAAKGPVVWGPSFRPVQTPIPESVACFAVESAAWAVKSGLSARSVWSKYSLAAATAPMSMSASYSAFRLALSAGADSSEALFASDSAMLAVGARIAKKLLELLAEAV